MRKNSPNHQIDKKGPNHRCKPTHNKMTTKRMSLSAEQRSDVICIIVQDLVIMLEVRCFKTTSLGVVDKSIGNSFSRQVY